MSLLVIQLVEAINIKKPVIATDCGGLGTEVIINNKTRFYCKR